MTDHPLHAHTERFGQEVDFPLVPEYEQNKSENDITSVLLLNGKTRIVRSLCIQQYPINNQYKYNNNTRCCYKFIISHEYYNIK